MKIIGKSGISIAVLLSATIGMRTAMFSPPQIRIEPSPHLTLPVEKLAENLSNAVRIATVSYENPDSINTDSFIQFRQYLRQTYPLVFARLEVETIHTHSLLFRWEGRHTELPPVLLLAHQDVVPPDAVDLWTHPPFSGYIDDTFIWGRGTLDDKSALIAIMEAVTLLLQIGFQPAQTIYFAFGHDEEIGGREGAMKIAEILQERGIRPAFVLDEGMAVVRNVMPGLDRPVALIGIAEKGYLTVKLTARAEGGHSSMPPAESAIGKLSDALISLKDHPPAAKLDGVAKFMFNAVGPHLSFFFRMIFANTWLFEPIILPQLEKQPSTNALIRTTIAITTVHGGNKENVLPTTATATVNFRIKPGETIDSVIEYVKETIQGSGVEITDVNREFASNPSKVSPVGDNNYNRLRNTIAGIFSGAVIAPGLVIGGTDSRHFEAVSDHIYRFAPLNLDGIDLKRIHGVNERISRDDFANMVRFYVGIMRNK